MADYNKVLRYKFEAICSKCGISFSLDKDHMGVDEASRGITPFSARSANTTVRCPKCFANEFRVNFVYKNMYRRRCNKCGEMFETDNTWQLHECDKCTEKRYQTWAQIGE